jgi:hypothetical protein
METTERAHNSRSLIKSKKRVADHGEVFTPPWLVEAMLDLTGESDRIEARFLEPACGNGNFLIRILQRKLALVELKSRESSHDKKYLALIAVMSIYGIELLEDNIIECRNRLLNLFSDYLSIEPSDELYRAASRILHLNLIHGDALKMRTYDNLPIVFAEWEYLGKNRFKRCDFQFDLLAGSALGRVEAIAPLKVYAPQTIAEIVVHSTSSRVREVTL